MARGATWTNSDGLKVPFGTHTADNEVPAVTAANGGTKVMVMEIVGINLVDTIAAANVAPEAPQIRRGSTIKKATLMVSEAFTSGGAATLDLGLWGVSAGVVDDADGIDVDIALTAIDAIGDVVICDGAVVNGVIAVGATANSNCAITASYETAVFTAGKATLIVEYIEPMYNSSVAA
jgi:hypothetical protein